MEEYPYTFLYNANYNQDRAIQSGIHIKLTCPLGNEWQIESLQLDPNSFGAGRVLRSVELDGSDNQVRRFSNDTTTTTIVSIPRSNSGADDVVDTTHPKNRHISGGHDLKIVLIDLAQNENVDVFLKIKMKHNSKPTVDLSDSDSEADVTETVLKSVVI